MKHCKKCGAEYEGYGVFCQSCGDKLINNLTSGYCKYCGCELVNDYERNQGCCVNCENPSGTMPSKPMKYTVKYTKRLKAMEILNYISGVLGLIMAFAAKQGLIGIFVLIICFGNGALYGAINELIKRD